MPPLVESLVHNVIPPFRFAQVQECLFRGAYPTLKTFRFLRRLRLKTIISVTPEPPTSDLKQFCSNEKIEMIHFEVERTGDVPQISPKTVALIVQSLISTDHLPLYLHCLDGGAATGTVIMVLRKLQNWAISAITTEFCRFTGDRISHEELQFCEVFKEEIELPPSIPEWLWGGLSISKHPTMRVKLPAPSSQPESGSITKMDELGRHSELMLKRSDLSLGLGLLGDSVPEDAASVTSVDSDSNSRHEAAHIAPQASFAELTRAPSNNAHKLAVLSYEGNFSSRVQALALEGLPIRKLSKS